MMEAVQCRMSERKIGCGDDYFRLIHNDRLEFIDLVNLLTVNETYFFREPVHLRILTDRLIPDFLSRKKPGERVRILSAGCSTGEEAYSIIMAATEKIGPSASELLHLTGVDIDSNAIMKAKAGIYGRQSFRSFDPSLKDRYFDGVGRDLHRVKDPFRKLVDFKFFNLLTPLYPEYLKGMDVVFYRNVSIYFDSSTQKKIFELLASIINEGGYLITSSTETLSHDMKVLALTEVDGTFLYRKLPRSGAGGNGSPALRSEDPCCTVRAVVPDWLGSARVDSLGPKSREVAGSRSAFSKEKKAPLGKAGSQEAAGAKPCETLYGEALLLAERKRYGEALAVLDELLAADGALVREHVLRAHVLTHLDRAAEAELACLETIRLDPMCLEAYLLLGLIAKRSHDADRSVKRFREALYIRSSCWVAHFHLAEIYLALGESAKARGEYKIVVNLLERDGMGDPGLNLFSLSIPPEQIVGMCRHKLAHLD
jgi:chemotaxis protein methyltransferase CheR